MAVPLILVALFWGLVGGSSLLLGAIMGYFLRLPQRAVAAIMAFGSGILICALSVELMVDAFDEGGLVPVAFGFMIGAVIFTLATFWLNRWEGDRRHDVDDQPSEEQVPGSGNAIAIGALLDGIPESIVIGISLIHGGVVSFVAVIAVFLSNLPEGLSSAAGMKAAGRGPRYIFGVWTAIMIISGISSLAGFTIFNHLPKEDLAFITALAAGAILAMLVETMIPEAYLHTRGFAGLIAVAGFLAAFVLAELLE